eukprot:m.132278 g.132278  ORF g.132278 m.132278 type:complete len:176 (-) comp15922_c0_seq7:2017-2544(-)
MAQELGYRDSSRPATATSRRSTRPSKPDEGMDTIERKVSSTRAAVEQALVSAKRDATMLAVQPPAPTAPSVGTSCDARMGKHNPLPAISANDLDKRPSRQPRPPQAAHRARSAESDRANPNRRSSASRTVSNSAGGSHRRRKERSKLRGNSAGSSRPTSGVRLAPLSRPVTASET